MLPGEYACEQGDVGEEMFFIVRGRIQIIYESSDGNRTELVIRKDGEFFGETALINNQPRSASAKALTYCDLLVYPDQVLHYSIVHNGVFKRVELASTKRSINVERIQGPDPNDTTTEPARNEIQPNRRK